MASAAATSRSFSYLLLATVIAAMSAALVAGFQFQVGGKGRGWKIPTGDEPETYNEWAAMNRFRIGDTLYFEYEKDSVLVVNDADYLSCNTSNPISEFEDGSTVFRFEQSGPFYFISGLPGHCKLGQRLIIRVMHRSEVSAPTIAPSPAPAVGGSRGGGFGDGRETGVSSAGKIAVVSCLVITLLGLFVGAYIFVSTLFEFRKTSHFWDVSETSEPCSSHHPSHTNRHSCEGVETRHSLANKGSLARETRRETRRHSQ
ncbi:early nodulin-like protein 1 [Striga asiatica]|uniref:Early nodulin-like protein 1 n=1 Tax=Striga asiatica TaxID=4170 RepID=A0A5A7QKT7_STRAF|nr:early nodulin-like protein 1 [Striga asiatica]